MKTKEEILKKLDDIENHIFMIDMIDHWQSEDEAAWDKLHKQKKELEEELERIENEGKQ